MSTTRSISAWSCGPCVTGAGLRRQFIGISLRSVANPECISALIARAWARCARSNGQPRIDGQRSAAYSQIASESHTVVAPSRRMGTLP
jgi:hypothetical protein